MDLSCPEVRSQQILVASRHDGHRGRAPSGAIRQFCHGAALVVALSSPGAAQRITNPDEPAPASAASYWRSFVACFASSILVHEGAHVAAAYAMGGRPSFGFDAGRPTVYSGIDPALEPGRQFVFSSAGLTTQTLIDEIILDGPHLGARPAAGPFERGTLAGGVATAVFYVTVGRTGSVSDVDFMARTSSLSKTTISLVYGGAAVVHLWRISHDDRYAHFFARPDPRGGMRIGVQIEERWRSPR